MYKLLKHLLFVLVLATSTSSLAQSNTDSLAVCYSTYLGGESEDFILSMQQSPDGSIYILGRTCSYNFPTTTGAVQQTFGGGLYNDQRYAGYYNGPQISGGIPNLRHVLEYDLFLTKMSSSGDMLYSTYFGGSGNEQFADMTIGIDGSVYVVFVSNSISFEVPLGTPEFTWGDTSAENKSVVCKFTPSGSIAYLSSIYGMNYYHFSTAYSNPWFDEQRDVINNIHVSESGKLYLIGQTTNTFAATPNAFQTSLDVNLGAGYCILDQLGNVDYATFISGLPINPWSNTWHSNISSALNDVGDLVIAGVTNSPTFPVSSNAIQPNFNLGTFKDMFVIKFDPNNQMVYSTYLGGSADESVYSRIFAALDEEGSAYIVGTTNSVNYPVTPNAFQTSLQNTSTTSSIGVEIKYDIVFTKIGAAGDLLYSTYIGGAQNDLPTRVKFIDNNLYISGSTTSNNFPITATPFVENYYNVSEKAFLIKFKSNCELVFSRLVGSNAATVYVNDFSVAYNGEIFLAGVASAGLNTSAAAPHSEFVPVFTPYGHPFPIRNACLFHFGGNGTLKFNSYWGNSGRAFVLADSIGRIHFAKTTLDTVNLNNQVANYFHLTQDAYQGQNAFNTSTNTIHQVNTTTYDPPLVVLGWRDVAYTIFRPLVNSSTLDSLINTVAPDTLISCLNGPVQTITGSSIGFTNSFWYPIFQWQFSNIDPNSPLFDPSNDWQNIPFSNTQNYNPSTFTSNRWYKRLVYFNGPQSCDEAIVEPYLVSESNVAIVVGSSNYAPQLEVGGNIFTCLNTPTTIANNATISGGQAPYQINWDFELFLNNSTILSPTASVPSTTIFTVEVIDANGCNNIDQMILFAYDADAGEDITRCPSDTVLIGSIPFIGEPASYSWSPSLGLSCADCPMPYAFPTSTTTYTLTKTIALPDGSTCSQIDNVVVTVPQNPNPVQNEIICYNPISNITSIGSSAQAGFNYSWFPQIWLEDLGVAQPIFNSENMFLHNTTAQNSNPMTYVRVATDGTCLWYDSLQLFMLRSSNMFPACGPTDLGYDWHPQIPASYEWTCLNGNCEFLGSQNTPSTTVGEPTNGPAVYQLEVCYEGVCCTGIVEVDSCEEPEALEQSPFCSLAVNIPSECPELPLPISAIGNFISPIMTIDQSLTQYTWFPPTNFDVLGSPNTSLISNNEPYYMVLITNPMMPGEICYQFFTVPLAIYPIFNPDSGILCSPGDEVEIGSESISFYDYFWEGPLNTTFTTSNPIVSIPGVYSYEVTNTISNCSISGEIDVLGFVFADAGEDQIVCPASNVQIGTADPSNGQWQYSWYPYLTPWQNGTNEFSPQPVVFAATDLNFTLTVFDSISGCLLSDEVNITINSQGPVVNLTDEYICPGESVVLGAEPIFGATYDWSPSLGLSCTDCPNPIASPNTSITYTLMIGFSGSCAPFIGEVHVFISDTSTLFTQEINKCPQALVELNPDMIGACPNCTYSWFPTIGLNNSNDLNPTCSINSSTLYTLTVIDAFGCSRSGTIQINLIPAETFIIPDVFKCPNSSKQVNPQLVGSCFGCSYSWAGGVNAPFSINPNSNANFNTQLTVTVTQTSGCQSIGTVNIFVTPPTYLPSETVEVCQGVQTQINSSLIGQCAGCSYLWQTPTGAYAGNTINPFVSSNNNTFRILTITQSNGCQIKDTFFLQAIPLMSPIVLPALTKCTFESIEINPELAGECIGCSYQWTQSSSGFILQPSSTVINPNSVVTNNQIYTLTSTPPSGCPQKFTREVLISNTVSIDVPNVERCDDSSPVPINPFQIGECNGCTYSWTPTTGLTSPTAINPASFFSNIQYTLLVTLPDGCQEMGTVLINSFAPTDMATSISLCSSSTALIGPSSFLANSSYSWSPTTGLTNPSEAQTTFTPSGFGNYIYTLTENRQVGPGQFCAISNQVFIFVDGVDLSDLNNHVNICQNTCQPIGINAQNGVSYSWSPSQDLSCDNCSNPTVCANDNQTYVVSAMQNVSGCMNQASVNIYVYDIPLPQVQVPDILVCDQSAVSLQLEIDPPGQYAFSWAPAHLVSNPNAQNPNVNTSNLNASSTFFTVNVTDLITGCSGITDTAWIHTGIADDIQISVVACEEYTAPNGITYYNSQNVTYLLENSTGCDSLVNINITIGFPSDNELFVTTCSPYEWAGNQYSASGVYTQNFVSSTGCDSLVTLHLTIHQPSSSEITETTCESYTWPLNGITYTQSGIYATVLQNSFGCDSTVTLHLTIIQPSTAEIFATACDSFTWSLNGNIYAQSGNYITMLQNAAGCDSIVTLNLTIQDSPNSVISINTCEFYTWDLNGVTYTESGNYIVIFPNPGGCDSTVTLNLTINHPSSSEMLETACESYTWPLNGMTYTESGSYNVVIPSSTDCDSTVTLHLTILQSSSKEITQVACESFYWSDNGQTYTNTGIYFAHLSNAAGCDSIVTLNLLILDFNVEVTTSNGILFASGGMQFQWVSCPSMEPISNATNSYFSPLENGLFAVIATDANGCVDTSFCESITIIGLDSEAWINSRIYPNPTFDYITIEFNDTFADVELYDAQGKLIRKTTIQSGDQISLNQEQSGVYFVRIITESGAYMHRVVKQW